MGRSWRIIYSKPMHLEKKDLHECISRPIQLHTCARQMKIYKTVNFGILNRHATHTHTPLSDVTQRIQ